MPRTRSNHGKRIIRKSTSADAAPTKTVKQSPKKSILEKSLSMSSKSIAKTPTKNRSSNVTATSPRKTRGVYKKEEYLECESCGLSEPNKLLQNCPNCLALFHLSCLGLEPEAIAYLCEQPGKWHCPRCISCAKCGEYVHDPENLQCAGCARAFHGACRPKKTATPIYPYIRWFCDKCEQNGHNYLNSNKPNAMQNQLTPSKKSGSLPSKKSSRQCPSKSPLKKNELAKRKSDIKIEESLDDIKSIADLQGVLTGNELIRERLIGSILVDPTLNATPQRPLSSTSKRQSRKRLFSKSSEVVGDSSVANHSDLSLAGKLPLQKINVLNQWIYFGQFIRFKPIYESSYRSEIASSPNVYVCEFCFRALADLCQFKNHLRFCPWKHPPGNEIYRDQIISIWEVEGNLEPTYCRNLCLLAKFFLSSKTLYHEVETFTFYILTENTNRGCSLAGYFSKEKNPSKNNNLSCLLTLPSHQGKGYGKILIDLSYHLSMREHKIGSPEHPLSDMGLITYRSYWKSAIVCALRRRRNQHSVSIKDLSIETAIYSCDIISTLLALGMITFRNDSFYIDTNVAFNASLLCFRRRTINPELLVWGPTFDVVPSNKMNSYASD